MAEKTTDNFLPHADRVAPMGATRPTTYASRGPLLEPGETATPVVGPTVAQARRANARPTPIKRRLMWVLAAILLVLAIAAGAWGLTRHRSPGTTMHAVRPSIASRKTAAPALAAPVANWPVRIKIPKIGVDAALEYVRLTGQGALAAPTTPATAGWYDRGPRPGEPGNAIIDGHFGWKNNIPAVFDNLHKLQKGDAISVIDEKGVSIPFTVRTVENYAENQADTAIFEARDTSAHLNLITCGGTWNAARGSYSNRLIVFADKQ